VRLTARIPSNEEKEEEEEEEEEFQPIWNYESLLRCTNTSDAMTESTSDEILVVEVCVVKPSRPVDTAIAQLTGRVSKYSCSHNRKKSLRFKPKEFQSAHPACSR